MTDWVAERVVRLAARIYMRSDARQTLERRILPALAAETGFRRVLFVGCAWYTWSYSRRFRGREYWTIEKRAAASRRYGGDRAIADDVCSLDRHFAPNALDIVICNGVLGWGLDRAADANLALAQFARALSSGGWLVLGWTDDPAHRPIDVDRSVPGHGFVPAVFPALGSARHVTKNVPCHVFSFYTKS